jgi:hypothetical protein
MKKPLTVVLLLFLFSSKGKAQVLNGRIVDAQSNKPIAFGSIGILHRDAGTVTAENGSFSLNPKNAVLTDTVRISMLGYETQQLSVNAFKNLIQTQNGKIELKPANQQLQEVVIRPKKTATIIAGNDTDSKVISAGFASNDLGSEVGTVLRYKKKKPGRLENVNFNIAYNSFDNLTFRVNIYDFKNGKIGANLLKEPLYLGTNIDSGILSLDLSGKNISISNDCLLSLEWIKDYGKQGLMFSAGFFNSDSFSRKISQGDWHKVPVGLGFWATVVHEK